MNIILIILISIIIIFVSFITAFITASLLDYRDNIKRKSDIFYQLSRDHNAVKRRAAK